ncbi:MAG TPA: hypothetical protein VLR93_05755, partial [Patescibacteria group bacterium]|nr:hypothetical protein [Patescibacteria group bacterium]
MAGSSGPGGIGLWMTAGLLAGLGMIFLLFTRRRRRPEEAEVVPAAAPAPVQRAPKAKRAPKGAGAMALATAGGPAAPAPLPVVPPRPSHAVVAAAVLPDTLDEEAHMPRWRRPSLQTARKAPSRGVEIA